MEKMKMSNPLMREKYVEVSWCPEDVKAIHPEWSDEKCMQALDKIAGYFEDRWMESGWELLEMHLDLQFGDEDE
jgi:hypothetical protein